VIAYTEYYCTKPQFIGLLMAALHIKNSKKDITQHDIA